MINQQNENTIDNVVFEKCPKPLQKMVELACQRLNIKNIDIFTLFDLCEIEPKIIDSILPGLFFVLVSELADGSTCLDLEAPITLEKLKEIDFKRPEKAIVSFIIDVNKNKFETVISFLPDSYLPLLLIQRSNRNYLYLNKSWTAEFNLNGQLEKVFTNTVGFNLKITKKILDEIYSKSPILDFNLKPRLYNDDQKNAIELALSKSFLIITGGPGTGKTFTLTGILRLLLRCGIDYQEIALAAPTAKAANRMNDSINENIKSIQNPSHIDLQLLELKSTTIHRLLGLTEYSRESKFSDTYPMPIKVLVIDEASMIDLYLMNTLLSSVDPQKTKIILLGDKDQLPSVESGAVLADLISGNQTNSVAYLHKTYRSHGEMLAFVNQIKEKQKGESVKIDVYKKIDQFLSKKDASVGLIDWVNLDVVQFKTSIQIWVQMYLKEFFNEFFKIQNPDEIAVKEYLNKINQTKILSVINNSIFGVEGINQICIDEIFSPSFLQQGTMYFHGMPIQILRNNDKLEIYNGDVGLIIKEQSNSFRVVFAQEKSLKSYAIDEIPHFQPAFATTIHKSQGSEYQQVLLVIPKDATEKLVTKQLLYTGISRAKSKCLLIATMHDFQKGLDNEMHRTTGILKP